MSAFPSMLINKLSGSRGSTDPCSHLRFSIETMPGARLYRFTPSTRAEIISELYHSLWGSYAHLFVPNSNSSLPMHALLSEVQIKSGFFGASKDDPVVPGRSCGHIFKKGQCCYRCKDCALDDSCVMCSRCFHATDHEGHNVTFYIAQQSGGCCDCGDSEAWRLPLACPYHSPGSSDGDSTSESGKKHTTTKTTASDSGRSMFSFSSTSGSPPADLKESMSKTVAYALDYILDTLDYSPEETNTVPASEDELKTQPSATPLPQDLYTLILWNDEKHAFDEVIQLICDLTSRSREQASVVADTIDEHGREIIEMSQHAPRLLEMARTINQIDLGVTVRRAFDTFREQVAAVMIEWLLDLTRARMSDNLVILREILAHELLNPRGKAFRPPISGNGVAKIHAELKDPARIDWLFLYHTRLWKKPRLNLKEIYVSVLTLSHRQELQMAIRFANVYHRIIDSYLLVDREAETSIKYFALQLFTVPSVALHIVRHHNIIQRLLDIIAAFFTNQIRDKRIINPLDPNAEVDVEAFPFKSKRFMPVFSDLRYICHNDSVQNLIAHNHEYIAQFARTCQLFMCVNPNKRAATSHVEYETDAWISVFNVTLSLSRVIKVYGEAYSRATARELIEAITTVMRQLTIVCTGEDTRQDRTKFPIPHTHNVVFGNTSYQLVDFNVLEGWVSFHHSLHWLLAELFKHVDTLSMPSLQTLGCYRPRDFLLAKFSEEGLMIVFDYPLRVLAMIAQIRTGLWVRNGFAIRGQLLHYRDFMLRELCYDQDIFMLQCAFMVLEPPTVLVTILDRFQLRGYFHGAILHEQYEGPHLYSMVEEVLYILITVLTEKANATKMPLRAAIRREIVHALAVGPCTFTDLVKRLAERMVDDVDFEHVLREVAHFKPPESISDTGLYELKDECYDEVSPFFYHFTRNKREEVETVLRTRLKKKTGVEDPVIVPAPIDINESPFDVLSSAFESDVMLQIMFYAIYNVVVISDSNSSTPASAEATLDQALHLVMLALVERPQVFAEMSALRAFEGSKNIIDIFCSLEQNETFKGYRARVKWILDRYRELIPNEVDAKRTVLQPTGGKGNGAEEAKKRAARARQEAIMKQMKAQQNSFAHNFDGMDEDDDNLDDESSAPAHVSYGTCIVCQEELNSSRSFGALGLIQPSRLIRRHPDGHHGYLNEALFTSLSLDRQAGTTPESFPPKSALSAKNTKPFVQLDAFPATYNRFGLHASICSHLMHLDCFSSYNSSSRHRLRAQSQRNHPENAARKEFICPLCKSLGNIMVPFTLPSTTPLNTTPFPEWIRAAGIGILKSKPDPQLDTLQSKAGTGEFVFWAAQDSGHKTANHSDEHGAALDLHKMTDTVIMSARLFSMQTRHLRDRPEPEIGERGAGLYLPEELVGSTVAAMEIAQRGVGTQGLTVADSLSESHVRLIRGLVGSLTKCASLQFRGRQDEGRDAVRQAIVKRLLPEWSRTSLTSYSYPLLLRNPFTLLVEAAAVAPEMLRHILILTYYACLARTVIGLVYILNKIRPGQTTTVAQRAHEDIFGDIRVFFISVVRHSPVFEHTAEMVFEALGDARVEKLMYTFTLPFLRQAAVLCRAMLPSAFPTPAFADDACEYRRLMTLLGIPPLSDLPNQDTIQNALSGWCAHYGHSHAAAQLNCGIYLEYPAIYQIAQLPAILDNLFGDDEKVLTCSRCKTMPNDAAICLICGTTVCLQSQCCSDTSDGRVHGECNVHTRECGGAIGMYFLVKRCTVLYLYAGNGSFGQSPYLDVHGEVDISMRRGRRQFLHHARWEEVRKTWLNHGIPTLIARKLESTIDNGGWETL